MAFGGAWCVTLLKGRLPGVPRTPFQTYVGFASGGMSLLESLPLLHWAEGEIPAYVIIEVLHPPTPQREGGAQWDLGVRVGTLGSQGPRSCRPCPQAEVHTQVGSDLSSPLPSC